MIPFRAETATKIPVLGIALSGDNIKKLLAKDPVFLNLQQLGADLPDMRVMIMHAENKEQVQKNLDFLATIMGKIDELHGGKKGGPDAPGKQKRIPD